MTTFLPVKYAVAGSVLKLFDNNQWTDGWIVEEVYSKPVEHPPDYRKGIKGHRKRTGDSLPKEPHE